MLSDLQLRERRRAVALMKQRYFEARMAVLDDGDPAAADPRLTAAIAIAERAILDGDPADGSALRDPVQAERARAARLMVEMFFAALEVVACDVDEIDERLGEAISGAQRDILGEYSPPELLEEPGALIEACEKLGIDVESRRARDGFVQRWVCMTCRKTGDWTIRTYRQRPLDHEHAASHTLAICS